MSDTTSDSVDVSDIDLAAALDAVEERQPLVSALTNQVTINDVANVALYWGALPVMSDDERDAEEMVAGAQGCLLNIGTVNDRTVEAMVATGRAANAESVPLVVDPVGVGATSVRSEAADRLTTELDVDVLKGNHGEITAITGEDATVRGVESVGEYADIAETAVACARETGAIVVASGETDIVATADTAFEVDAGHGMMGTVVGTGCMLGVSLAVFSAVVDDELEAALTGALAFGLAGEAAADGAFGDYEGPASYRIAFLDAVAGLSTTDLPEPADRFERVVDTD